MRKELKKIIVALLLCFTGAGFCAAATTVMPLDQIKPGMVGKGKSVFKENKIEEFEVEILGIMYNVFPQKDIILARLKGLDIDRTGVISGMSGSPVYIDGKIIGAIAYSFPFSKDPIAGITPIGEMLSIREEKETPSSRMSSTRMPITKSLTLDELFDVNKDLFRAKAAFFSENQSLRPISMPLVFSGFSSQGIQKAKPFFTRLGFFPVKSGTSIQTLGSPQSVDVSLREGDPVAIQLVGGDLDLSVIGTVTYVDGNSVLAFGHPFYNIGPVDYAMTKVRIITVVPSVETSFKLSTSEGVIGKFTQDRTAGALGEIGKMPSLIPLNVKLFSKGIETKEFKLKVVNDKILTPVFTNVALMNILSTAQRAIGDLSLELDGDIYMDNGMSVHLEDLYSGNFDSAVVDLSGLITAVVYFMSNNEFEDLGIHRIDLKVDCVEEPMFSYLERVWLDRYEASPGDRIQVKVYFRTFRGEGFLQEVALPVPNLPPGSEFRLVIADAASMQQVEMAQYRVQDFVPRNLAQLIRILNNLRKNNRVYFKVIASKPGLFLKGEEMPNLPLTMKSMFASPRAASSSANELNTSTLMEYQLPLPYIFKGMTVIPIKIRN